MSYFQIGISPESSFRNAGKAGFTTSNKTAIASVHGLSTKKEDPIKSRATVPTSGGYKVTAASGFETNRFSAPNEPLDRNSFLDDITPKGDNALITMFNNIYREDAVAGSATDLIATLPWSDWTLSGVDDPAIMRIYEEAMEKFNPEVTMPDISRDFLKLGRVILSLVFNQDNQTWDNFIAVDPMFCDIIPVPISGFDPLINMRTSPEMQALLASKDPRAKLPLASLPVKMRKLLEKGSVPLEPLTTLFVNRKVSLTDWKGTSLYHRILPYYAIERALMTSTISSARRRTRSILHLTCGIEDKWDPTPDQLNDIIEAFETTEEDPVGAVIATRSGIEANEIRSGADFWKISEEADFLRTSKLAALGLSESFLSGEASYTTVDASMSVFIENLKVFRANLTQRVFYNKYFENLARAHNFVKRKEADLAHGVRTSIAKPSMEEAMNIPRRELMLPNIHWTKNLSPESDASYMEILKSAQEQGVPITLKQWAAAAGIDVTTLEQMLPEDQELRKRIKKFMPKPPPDEEGGGAFGSVSNKEDKKKKYKGYDIYGTVSLGSVLQDDPTNSSVLGVSHREFTTVVGMLTKDNRTQRILQDDIALSRWLSDRYEGDDKQVDGMRYLLTRSGFADCRIESSFINNLAMQLNIAAKAKMDDRNFLKRVQHEITILAAIYNFKSDRDTLSNTERSKQRHTSIDTAAKDALSRNRQGNLPASKLYSGV